MSTKRDPAETHGYLRYFYRNWRPTRLGRLWSRSCAWLVGLGILPPVLAALHVRDRNTGATNGVVLATVRFAGQSYLVSMLGNKSGWVQNVRAARGKAQLKRGGWRDVILLEVAPDERAPILKAWSQVASSGRKHLPLPQTAPVEDFARIAADYPVFRIDDPR